MSSNDRKGQYTTLRIAPIIYARINKLVTQVQERNRKYSVSAFINAALLDALEKFPQLNEKTVDEWYQKYEELKTGHAGNLK
jgi:hypothetical protein